MEIWQLFLNLVIVGVFSIYWRWAGFFGSIIGVAIYFGFIDHLIK